MKELAPMTRWPVAERTPARLAARCWPGVQWLDVPYSRRTAAEVEALAAEIDAGRSELIILTAGRTDRPWFDELGKRSALWLAIQGRLRFPGHSSAATFPSALFYVGCDPDRFQLAYDGAGLFYKMPRGQR